MSATTWSRVMSFDTAVAASATSPRVVLREQLDGAPEDAAGRVDLSAASRHPFVPEIAKFAVGPRERSEEADLDALRVGRGLLGAAGDREGRGQESGQLPEARHADRILLGPSPPEPRLAPGAYFGRSKTGPRLRLDSRLIGPAPLNAGETGDFDPSMSDIRPPYTAMFNQYVSHELGYKTDATYYVLGGGILPWDYGTQNQNRYVDVSESLRSAFAKNPHMKVFVGCGYFDMATPYFAAQYTFSHMGLQPSARKNVTFQYYTAGHMFYIDVPSHKKLKGDITQFVKDALPMP